VPYLLAARGVRRLDLRDLRGVQRAVEGRHAEVRRALEDGEVRARLGDFGDDLQPGGARADDADALAGQVDGRVRPAARAVDLALEVLLARELVLLRDGDVAAAGDDEARGAGPAVVGADGPDLRGVVPLDGRDARVEAEVLAHVELVRTPLEVAQDLRLRGEALAPAPLSLQLGGEGVGVEDGVEVAARPRVAVPVPGPAGPRAGVEGLDLQPEVVTQLVHRVQPGKPCADDDDVVIRLHVSLL
jgi:hypothetical protein